MRNNESTFQKYFYKKLKSLYNLDNKEANYDKSFYF